MTSSARPRAECALCRATSLEPVFRLPPTPIANEFVLAGAPEQELFQLGLVMCQVCKHVQIDTIIDSERLFANYVYATATSPVTIAHLHDQAQTLTSMLGLRERTNPLVIEIGSNDGTLLRQFRTFGIANVLGIDPAAQISETARQDGIDTVTAFFTADLARQILKNHGSADLVVANNVLAHTENVRDALEGVRELLAPRSCFVFEVSHLYDMHEAPVFDTIYHEHMSYHTVSALARVLDELRMPIVRVDRVPGQIGRGSLRVYATPIGISSKMRSFDCPQVRKIMLAEHKAGLDTPEFYEGLQARIKRHGSLIQKWIEKARANGQAVVGYGAPAKVTTLMYSLGIDSSHVDYIVDDSPWKQGRLTPGTRIKVEAPEMMLEEKPGTVVVFAWNFADSITKRHSGFGGTFMVPLPDLYESR